MPTLTNTLSQYVPGDPQAPIETEGFAAVADGGGGRFIWDPASMAVDNGGTVIRPASISSSSPGRWLLGNRHGIVNYRQWGLQGTVDPANPSAAPDETALLSTALTHSGVLDLGTGKFRTTGEILLSRFSVRSQGAEIYRTDDGTTDIVRVNGTAPTYHDLDANANAGENFITCAALALLVKAGDLVKIKSTGVYFVTSESSRPGEMHLVQHVDGSVIYLSEPLEDSYVAATGGKAGLVSAPAHVNIEGKLVLHRDANNTTAQTLGFKVVFGINPRVNIAVVNARERGVTIEDCYAPDVEFFTANSVLATSGGGYGLSIVNATMYGRFTGTAVNARHAVAIGAAPVDGGVSWGNRVSGVTGVGGYASTVFDAHASCGSVYYENCTAIGGLHTKFDGVVVRPDAFNLGARYSYVTECRAIRCWNGVAIDGSTVSMETLDVNGLVLTDCTGMAVQLSNAWTGTVRSLRVRNVRGNIVEADDKYAVLLSGGTVEAWDFEGIRINGPGLIYVGSPVVPPATLQLRDCVAEGGTGASSVSVSRACIRVNNAAVTALELDGCVLDGRSIGVFAQTSLALRLYDSTIRDMYVAAWLTATPTACEAYNSRIETTHAQSTYGVFNVTVAGTTPKLAIDGCTVTNDVYIHAHTGSVKNILHGINEFRSGVVGLARNLAAGWLEYVGGSVNMPRILRGAGTPEGVVAAPIGTRFSRVDGSAGTLEYLKGTASGNTGWVAIH